MNRETLKSRTHAWCHSACGGGTRAGKGD